MNTRLAIRGFADGCKVFEEFHDISDEDLDSTMGAMAERHATQMVDYGRHMIELDFLDDPDPNERFCRFGTDASGSVVAPRRGDFSWKEEATISDSFS